MASLLFAYQPIRAAGVITVTTTADVLAEDGQCSLREAILAANTDTATGGCAAGNGADTIVFAASLPTPAVFALTLTGANEDAAASGDLDVQGVLTLQATPGQVIVDGNGTDRVFDIRSGANVTLMGLTIRNGNPAGGSSGGGVRIVGTMPVTKLTLLNSLVLNNHAVSGGGIQTEGSGATLVMQDSHVSGNVAEVAGGGIANNGVVNILNSTLDHNQARSGGGMDHEGVSLKITNVTLSNNQASDNGGGLYNRASATLLNVTFADNRTLDAGGGATLFDTASLTIKNSMVFNGPGVNPCATNGGMIISQGHNLESANTCGFTASGDLVNTNPQLGPLQNNGGSTPTQALSAGSPAVDGGDNSGCPATDQRGFPRPVDGDGNGSAICDIGAFEYGASLPPTGTPTASLTALPVVTETLTFTLTSLPPALTDIPTFTAMPVETGTATQTETPFPPETPSPTSTSSLPPTPPPPIPPCSSASIPLLVLGLWFLRPKRI